MASEKLEACLADGGPAGAGAHGDAGQAAACRAGSSAPDSARARRAPRDARVTHPERIFVSVAAYRDEEAQWTVADLFRQAAAPERVRVGIVWQARTVLHGRRPWDASFSSSCPALS